MLHRLCEPPSIPLSFSCDRTPQAVYLILLLRPRQCQDRHDLVDIVYSVDYRGI